jgi:hypothetical protein
LKLSAEFPLLDGKWARGTVRRRHQFHAAHAARGSVIAVTANEVQKGDYLPRTLWTHSLSEERQMSQAGNRTFVLRIVKSMLGTDRLSYIAAVAAVCLVLGNVYVFSSVGLFSRPKLSFWQAAGDGLAVSLLLMPFFLISLARALWFLSPWEGLATLTATGLVPVLFQRLVAGDTAPLPLRIILPIAFIVAVFMTARWLERSLSGRDTSNSDEVET